MSLFDAHALLAKMHKLSMIDKKINGIVRKFYFTNGSAKMHTRVWAIDQKKSKAIVRAVLTHYAQIIVASLFKPYLHIKHS